MQFWIINALGIFLIVFIIWWFWLAKSQAFKKVITTTSDVIDITVENGVYNPDVIKINSGEKIKLRFFRKDPSPCAEWVIFQELNISEQLPINRPQLIELKIDSPGKYEFTCQMGMYRGKLIVAEKQR